VPAFLVLWDVDYTLLDSTGVGRRLYRLAFAELFGRELPFAAAGADMAGRTDRAIALDVLAMAGVPDPAGQVSAFEETLARLAPSLAGLVATTAVPMPGAADALEALAALGAHAGQTVAAGSGSRPEPDSPEVWQSLLTGNVRAMAEVKLAPLGLTNHLDLDVGAYGNESAVRSDLVHLARERASDAYDADFDGEATVLIGDTPLDVQAALAAGARAVGVATGRFTVSDLAASGAHAVLGNLADTDEVIAAVLGR